MAVLTANELAELRRKIAEQHNVITWNKPIINAALQAIEDWFESNKSAGSIAVDAATAPFTFSGPQKKKLFTYWLLQKFSRESV